MHFIDRTSNDCPVGPRRRRIAEQGCTGPSTTRNWQQTTDEQSAIKRHGLMETVNSGREICMSYDRSYCQGRKRAHCCENCLGNHRGADKICWASRSSLNKAEVKGKGKGKKTRGHWKKKEKGTSKGAASEQ